MPTIVDTAINTSPALKAAYEALLGKVVSLGPVVVEPKKTSVHLKARVAFAGVHVRKDCLIVQVVAEGPIPSPRVFKAEQVSRNRYHNHVRVASPQDVDDELLGWLKAAYQLTS